MLTSLLIGLALNTADASSHREAPGIALDPSADITDFYAFLNPNDSSKIVFIMNVNPLENPGGGPNFHRFDDDVIYAISIDNEGDGLEDIRFGFKFETTYNIPDSFLYNVGPVNDPSSVNLTQTIISGRWDDQQFSSAYIPPGSPWPVAPINVGGASTPAGAYAPFSSTPGTLTTDHIYDDGVHRIFAGPRQDSFFVDLENTFDLLNLGGPNYNTLLGYNVHSIVIEVPVSEVTRDGLAPSVAGCNSTIAAWATTSRHRFQERQADGGADILDGPFNQVARLGNPLVNEVVIGMGDKDLFNRSQPVDDAQFLDYVRYPLLPAYMDAILGIADPVSCDLGLGLGGREDLIAGFLTPLLQDTCFTGLGGAIPGEPGKAYAAFDALRINMTQPTGFPNGRTVDDDVVDVALSVMAGTLCPTAAGFGGVVGDGVDASGLSILPNFPFLGDPWSGNDHPQEYHGPLASVCLP